MGYQKSDFYTKTTNLCIYFTVRKQYGTKGTYLDKKHNKTKTYKVIYKNRDVLVDIIGKVNEKIYEDSDTSIRSNFLAIQVACRVTRNSFITMYRKACTSTVSHGLLSICLRPKNRKCNIISAMGLFSVVTNGFKIFKKIISDNRFHILLVMK